MVISKTIFSLFQIKTISSQVLIAVTIHTCPSTTSCFIFHFWGGRQSINLVSKNENKIVEGV